MANWASCWMSCGNVAENSRVCLVVLSGSALSTFSTSGLQKETSRECQEVVLVMQDMSCFALVAYMGCPKSLVHSSTACGHCYVLAARMGAE